MIVKVLNPEQVKTTAEIAHTIWNHHYVPIIGQDQVDYMLEHLQSERAISEQIESGYEYYLIYQEKTPVGYLSLRPNYPEGKIMISKIYIDATTQGKGYGYELLEFVKKLTLKRSFKSVWLTVNRHNSNTINWYQKRGFEVIGEKKLDIGNGFVMDDLVMEASADKLLS
ncbi:MAG: GNAT family N-acetyltransferase [Flavobacteriaceae bacterium]|nr:GNAT family N-acetyltransferase [Flavobacteriaceae bacterium]